MRSNVLYTRAERPFRQVALLPSANCVLGCSPQGVLPLNIKLLCSVWNGKTRSSPLGIVAWHIERPRDYSILVHFLSFPSFRRITAPMDFAGEPNCKNGYEKGRWLAVPYPKEATAQAACSEERTQLRKPLRPQTKALNFFRWQGEGNEGVKCWCGKWERLCTSTAHKELGSQQDGNTCGEAVVAAAAVLGTEKQSRRGPPRFWSGGGKQQGPAAYYSIKIKCHLFFCFSSPGAREEQFIQSAKVYNNSFEL